MKNVKLLGFVGLWCALLLLTGCEERSGHLLTCTRNEGDMGENKIGKFEIKFNGNDNEVVSLKYYYTLEIADSISTDEIEELKDYAKESWCSEDYVESCNVSFNENILEIQIIISPSRFDEVNLVGTLDEVKKRFETDNYSCNYWTLN